MAVVNTLNGNPLKAVNPHLLTRPSGEAAKSGFQPSFRVVNTATFAGSKVTPGEPLEVAKNNWS